MFTKSSLYSLLGFVPNVLSSLPFSKDLFGYSTDKVVPPEKGPLISRPTYYNP